MALYNLDVLWQLSGAMVRSAVKHGCFWIGVCCVVVVCTGCASLPRTTFTAQDQSRANIRGYVGIRTWADASEAELRASGFKPPSLSRSSGDLNYLSLSAGGAGGAFGAGLLKGWTHTGSRPKFDIVSGVSTGALIAPFAFLGTSYDDQLEELYLGNATGNLAILQSPFKILSGAGLYDPRPLRTLIERYTTEEMLARIAVEHRLGRRLYVVTTNLDAQRPVVWDMGAIAASGRPDALSLFRNVLIASASIPAAYQPVMIDVVAEGKHFQEMHVDGGTTTEVLTIPDVFLASGERMHAPGKLKMHLYIVIHNNLSPEFEVIRNRNVSVAARAFSTVIKSQTRDTLLATYSVAKRWGIDFNIASIDRAVPFNTANPFGKDYMRQVFKSGLDQATSHTAWRKSMSPNAAPVAQNRPQNMPYLTAHGPN